MFELISHIPYEMLSIWPGADQGLYSHLFLSKLFPMSLDYFSVVFQSFGFMHTVEEASLHNGANTNNIIRKGPYNDSAWYNYHMRHSPPVIHFNADGKNVMHNILDIDKRQVIKNFGIFNNKTCGNIHIFIEA